MKIGIIGFGKMGDAIAQGLKQKRSGEAVRFEIQGTTRSSENASEISKRLEIRCHTDNQKLVEASEVILLCVKPHQAEKVLESIAPSLKKSHLLISICASITTEQLRSWSGGKACACADDAEHALFDRTGNDGFLCGPWCSRS